MYMVVLTKLAYVIPIIASMCIVVYGQSRPITSEGIKARTLRVEESLQGKPDWLFPAVACPAAVMPATVSRPKYQLEGCKDDPEACLALCKADDPTACQALALLIQHHTAIYNEISEALFLRSCKLGIVSGCTNRAAAKFELEEKDPVAQKCAVDTFQKGCDLDDPWSCTMYGFALSEGISRKKDLKAASVALTKACAVSSTPESPACTKANQLKQLITAKPR